MAGIPGQSAVRVFLAAALNPNVQAASRWIAVNAVSRKAFALGGKDAGTPLLQWLAALASRRYETAFADAARRLGVEEVVSGTRYLDWYRRLNHGYPFADYTAGGALEADAQLMASYAAGGDAPPPTTPWPGDRRTLPAGRLEPGAPPTAALLAAWLRLAAGITALRPLPTATASHRTSPSGGARHPTDVAVRVGAGWGPDLDGTWWYDALAHAVVASDWALPEPPPRGATFAVTSHVERAMWRYRDVRAFRPVLIDAGHVIETLLVAVTSAGWTGRWHAAPQFVTVGDRLDPVVGYVLATPRSAPDVVARPLPAGLLGDAALGADLPAGAVLRTSPFVSLAVTGDGLVVENHLAPIGPLEVSPAVVDTLAHATPSSRRDRPSTIADLEEATGVDAQTVAVLVERGLLVDERIGNRWWALGREWFHHDWYLSLLAHAEEASTGPMRPDLNGVTQPTPHLPAALTRRRTCRNHTGEPLRDEDARRALEVASGAGADVAVHVVLRHEVAGLRPGMFTLRDGAWIPSGVPTPSEDDVRVAAIGQPWAHGFALCFWLVPRPEAAPGAWEAALVECGRLAQRVALAVSHDPGVGVFQSPALVDEFLGGILGEQCHPDGAYLVGIGAAGDTPPARERLFEPTALFADAPAAR